MPTIKHIDLARTLGKQRASLVVEPIHFDLAPVQRYAAQIAAQKNEPYIVVQIPEGTAAYSSGYRYVSIPETERDYYEERGAVVIAS